MVEETIKGKVEDLILIIDSTTSSLDEQLDAIKKLGKLKSPEACSYLKKISEIEKHEIDRSNYGGEPAGWPSQYSYIAVKHHPNAKGALYQALRVETGYDEWSNTPGSFGPEYHSEYDKARTILAVALSGNIDSIK